MDTQSSGARILILGGYGRVGQEAARYLLNATDAKVALSSRMARPLPVWAGPGSLDRLTNQQLDVFDGEALVAACARSDLVISCAGPSGLIGERVAMACKRAGVPLVEAGGYDPLLHSLQQAQASAPTSVPLVINVGLLPGLSGLFPKWLLDTRRDTQLVEALDVYYVGRDAWTYNSAWDIINSLGGFGHDRGFCYLNGQNVVRVPMRKAARKVNFPDPIGSASIMLIYSEEIARLACQWEIDTARVYGANDWPSRDLVCMLAKVLRFYQTPRAVARGARWLARASARDMQKLEPAYGIHVDLHYRGGRTASATLTLDDTYRATGTVIGIAAHQLLDEGPGPAYSCCTRPSNPNASCIPWRPRDFCGFFTGHRTPATGWRSDGMNSVKKIIVLGGHGETGRRIVGNLSLRYPDLQVTIGSRRAAPASDGTTPIVRIDTNDRVQALEVLSHYDLAIIALGPMHVHGSTPHQLCIEAGSIASTSMIAWLSQSKSWLCRLSRRRASGRFHRHGFTQGCPAC